MDKQNKIERRGGWRPGAGRKKKDPKDLNPRTPHQVSAFDDEWVIIKEFVDLVRKDKILCKKVLDILRVKDD